MANILDNDIDKLYYSLNESLDVRNLNIFLNTLERVGIIRINMYDNEEVKEFLYEQNLGSKYAVKSIMDVITNYNDMYIINLLNDLLEIYFAEGIDNQTLNEILDIYYILYVDYGINLELSFRHFEDILRRFEEDNNKNLLFQFRRFLFMLPQELQIEYLNELVRMYIDNPRLFKICFNMLPDDGVETNTLLALFTELQNSEDFADNIEQLIIFIKMLMTKSSQEGIDSINMLFDIYYKVNIIEYDADVIAEIIILKYQENLIDEDEDY
jgi:hypothetical protein